MVRPILCLALALIVSACAPPSQPKPVPVAEARARLIGLPLAHIRSCMGAPPIAMARGSIALWSYPSAVWDPPPQIVTDPGYTTFDVTPFAGDPDPNGIAMNAPLPQSRCVVKAREPDRTSGRPFAPPIYGVYPGQADLEAEL